jgi:hypothetical protein
VPLLHEAPDDLCNLIRCDIERESNALGVAALFPISLTPRFSEVDGPVYYHNRFSSLLVRDKKTAEAVGLPPAVLTPS